MPKLNDLTGQVFGRWLVLDRAENKNGLVHWNCECECGAVVAVRSCNLVTGLSKQCNSCSNKARDLNQVRQDPLLVGLRARWRGMMSRCYNKKDPDYRFYGARKASVCKEWHDMEVFIEWALLVGLKKGLCMHRKTSVYSPDTIAIMTYKDHGLVHGDEYAKRT